MQHNCCSQKKGTKTIPQQLARPVTRSQQAHPTPQGCVHTKADHKAWASVQLQDDPLVEAFECNVALLFSNVATRRCYLRNLATLRRLCGGRPIRDLVIPSPKPMLTALMHAAHHHNIKANTIKNMLTALLCLLSNVLSNTSKAKKEVQHAFAMLKHAPKQAKLAAKTRATKQQWVTYDDLCKARGSLPLGTQERLFMEFITAWPNIDGMHECEIVSSERAATKAQVVLQDTHKAGSAVLVYPPKPDADQPKRVSLSGELTSTIRASLEHEPRQHLFAFRAKAANRPYKQQAFLKWAGKLLKNATGNPAATLTKARKVVAAHHLEKGGNTQTMALALGLPVQSVRKQCRETLSLLKCKTRCV